MQPARPAPTIGLDARNLSLPHGTGVATYAATLVAAIRSLGLETEILDAIPSLPHPLRWLRAAWPGVASSHPAPGTRSAADVFRIAQVHFDLWRRLRPVGGPNPPTLMHWTYPLPLRFRGIPNLCTIHDLIPLEHPGLTGIEPARFRRMLACIVRSADHLVTVSETTRQALVAEFRLDPARVTNTWQAVDVAGADPAPPEGLTPGAYWLHVGALDLRKNLPRTIAAWRHSGTTHPLVLAGPDGSATQAIAGVGPVIRLPWVPRPQLLALIRDARALLMPSLAEGFGLPVAEAMALGTPVLTSNRGALAEIAGNATLLVDPMDGPAITAAIRALDSDPVLRARLAGAGPARARLFAPAAYATRLEALYRNHNVPEVR